LSNDMALVVLGLFWHITVFRVPTPPGKSWIFSWKFQDLESPGNWSLRSGKVLEKYPWKLRIFIGSNGKQAEIVNVPVCVDFYLVKWLVNFAAFGFPHFASCYSFCNGLHSERCE